MNTELKRILISILIGAIVAFLQVLFAGLLDVLNAHKDEIISGMATSAAYLAQRGIRHS